MNAQEKFYLLFYFNNMAIFLTDYLKTLSLVLSDIYYPGTLFVPSPMPD